MCSWLAVSSSGFFDWRKRPQSVTASRRERLALLIAHEFADSDETYGYRRVHAALARSGVHCGPELVRESWANWAYGPASRGRGGPA